MPVRMAVCLMALGAVLCAGRLGAQTGSMKVTPAALVFTHQTGAATLPKAQSLAVSGTSSTASFSFTAQASGGAWLTISPVSGVPPATIKVAVNPTSLAVGSYSGAIAVTAATTPPQVLSIAVTLTVTSPPPSLSADPSPLSVTHVRDASATTPLKQTLSLSSSGGLLAWSAKPSGGRWLSISPLSGVISPAFSSPLVASIDPTGLDPGTYKGAITITAPAAANKSLTVTVNLTVNAGVPELTSLWPLQVPVGSGATTITLNGGNFYAGTIVKANGTALSTTFLGPNAMTAVIPSALLANAATLPVAATNPGPGGGDSSPANFTVAAPGPTIGAVVSAASLMPGAVAPGMMLAVFGSSLGADPLGVYQLDSSTGRMSTTLNQTKVYFDTTEAPVVYASSGQLGVMVPYDVAAKQSVQMAVEYNGARSADTALTVAASAPGIFTSNGAGSGQAAAFNVDSATGAYTLNTDTTAALKGSVVVFYATGEGVTSPASQDGEIVTQAASASNPAVSLTVGGEPAAILYSGGVPGLVAGIIQINARLPTAITAGKAAPMVLTINGVNSQAGVTIGVR